MTTISTDKMQFKNTLNTGTIAQIVSKAQKAGIENLIFRYKSEF